MNSGILKIKSTALFCIFLIFGQIIYGQQKSIIKFLTVDTKNFTKNQSDKLEKIKKSSLHKDAQIIQIDKLNGNATNGKIHLTLPSNKCKNLIFTASRVEYKSENDYYWYGEVKNEHDGGCDGSIMLMAKDGRKFGTILIDGESYEYQDLSNGYQVLSKVKTELFTEKECGVNSKTPVAEFKVSDNPVAGRTVPCVGNNTSVRILVLWTQAAQNAEANINDRVNLAIAQTNQAYLNSGVGNLNVVLAGSQLLPGFIESPTGDIREDVNNLAVWPVAQTLRNTTQADLVVLLTNGNYGSTFGIVQTIGPSFAGAYSIVQTNAATGGRFTFAHEVGHLFGARHSDDINGTIQHGYEFWTRKWFLGSKITRYTLLAQLPAGATRELHYSNPNIEIQNKPSGTSCCNNNAQMHTNTFPTVSSFFAGPTPPFNASIEWSQANINCFPQQAEAVIQCGTAPYTFLWETSSDGINYIAEGNEEILPTGGNCIQGGEPFSFNIFYRLTVTDANGVVAIATRNLLIQWLGDNPIAMNRVTPNGPSGEVKTGTNILEKIFPNPATANSKVIINIPVAGQVKIEVVDVMGHLKTLIKMGNLVKGRNIVDLNLEKLPSGVYRINLYYNNAVESKQILVNR